MCDTQTVNICQVLNKLWQESRIILALIPRKPEVFFVVANTFMDCTFRDGDCGMTFKPVYGEILQFIKTLILFTFLLKRLC